MKKFMVECAQEAPQVCQKVYQNKDENVGKLVELFLAKDYKGIVLVGSGSSYNIAASAKYAIEKYLKTEVKIYTPVSFEYYDYKHSVDHLVIFMSQSGRSTNTVNALNVAKANNYDIASLTMVVNNPLAKVSENAFYYGSWTDEADSYVCRGFSASALYLILFALEAGVKKATITKDEYKAAHKELNAILKNMTSVHEAVEKFYGIHKNELYNIRRAMTLGIGPTYATALESCLKFSETTGIATNGYELEEFLHGPAYEVKKDHAVFIIDVDEKLHERAMKIYEASKELTDKVYVVTCFDNYVGNRVIKLSEKFDPVLMPLITVIPFQLIPGHICEDLNIRAVTICNYRASQIAKSKLN
ncbi:MAG: SIS domain-containing protein [Erysipelotrichaceae bacterium]|nr:SIS domain-containing protein [Erysipelotrichaceae bacterium]